MQEIFECYASDPEVTRFLTWPTHQTIADAYQFLEFSEAEWSRWQVGPYLIELRAEPGVVGSTGLAFPSGRIEQPETGYVLTKQAWGRGFATKALLAMVNLARELGTEQIAAFCNIAHVASQRVVEKAGFVKEASPTRSCRFPNLYPGDPMDSWRFERNLVSSTT